MPRLATILVLLVLVVTVTPVAADTITFLDGTESVSVVAVGDRKKIEPQLRKLELGQVEARDIDGKPVVAAKN